MRRGWPPDIPLAGSFDGAYSGTSRTPSPTQNRECQTYSFSLNSVVGATFGRPCTVTANRRVNTLGILKQDRFITSTCTLTRSSGITGTTFSDLQVYRSGGTLGISFRVNTGSATGVAGNNIIVGALTIPGLRVVTGAAASTFNGSLSAVCLLGAGTTPTVIMRATSNTAANTYYSVNLTAVCVEV